ncbi:hypothetical protein MTBBW1_1300015 [Desulfamplus magnetovallimortis]|uniref:Uncharacterized protein n=1 Tax=Desulfamplus magnetovallimortis TaxID=1246637 RepID=A0A1W1H7B6_9BACT|nr:hypothetical protein [Desulfamplus magnetovallimortis]SLM28275.1 hypothetical protein MTBBW1_1300015 [Desulfamplus magnetovallimortis]
MGNPVMEEKIDGLTVDEKIEFLHELILGNQEKIVSDDLKHYITDVFVTKCRDNLLRLPLKFVW